MAGEEEKKAGGYSTKEELFQAIADIQGTIMNLQETVESLSHVKEDQPTDPKPEEKDDPSKEEVDEVDAFLND